jgi:ubiquinone/menaquinone biosynthesis C-methylase UbiE
MSRSAEVRALMQAAAWSRIRELRRTTQMTTRDAGQASTSANPWALGDYHRFAMETVWQVGPVVVEACGISADQRVLDVAAGTGNVAIRAAMRGAQVVAADITAENFAAGQCEAAAQGVELGWVEADAQDLPFGDGTFDVVTSVFGAMFAPDQQAAAGELVRVCRPGGVIGMANFTPEGLGGEFFELFARYAPPPPPGAASPVLWGSEEHVRTLFGERVELDLQRRHYTERAASPQAYRDFFKETFGPAVAIYAGLADDARRAFDREFLDWATRTNSGSADGPTEYRYEYLLVVGRRLG